MEIVAIVSVLILIEYWIISFLVGVARSKTGVKAPAMLGAAEFERTSRVQQNTLEQLIVLLPAMWLFAFYVHALAAAGLGVLFMLGRVIYFRAYLRDPAERGLGFAIGQIAQAILLLGGLLGVILALLK
jgi:uncharacterized MAPEG superfamily protein